MPIGCGPLRWEFIKDTCSIILWEKRKKGVITLSEVSSLKRRKIFREAVGHKSLKMHKLLPYIRGNLLFRLV